MAWESQQPMWGGFGPKHPTLNQWNSLFPSCSLLGPRLWLVFDSNNMLEKFGQGARGGQFKVRAPAMGS